MQELENTDSQSDGKPQIFFTQPRYAKEVVRMIFPGSNRDKQCWNCGKEGHQFTKCKYTLDNARIAARKLKFY